MTGTPCSRWSRSRLFAMFHGLAIQCATAAAAPQNCTPGAYRPITPCTGYGQSCYLAFDNCTTVKDVREPGIPTDTRRARISPGVWSLQLTDHFLIQVADLGDVKPPSFVSRRGSELRLLGVAEPVVRRNASSRTATRMTTTGAASRANHPGPRNHQTHRARCREPDHTHRSGRRQTSVAEHQIGGCRQSRRAHARIGAVSQITRAPVAVTTAMAALVEPHPGHDGRRSQHAGQRRPSMVVDGRAAAIRRPKGVAASALLVMRGASWRSAGRHQTHRLVDGDVGRSRNDVHLPPACRGTPNAASPHALQNRFALAVERGTVHDIYDHHRVTAFA